MAAEAVAVEAVAAEAARLAYEELVAAGEATARDARVAVKRVREATRVYNARALGRACQTLGDLAADNNMNKIALLECGAPAALVKAMHAALFCGRASALEQVCRAIRHLAVGNYASKAALLTAGAPTVLISTLHESIRVFHAGVMAQACSALAALAELNFSASCDRRRTALVQAGAPMALVAVIHEAIRIGHTVCLRDACGAIGRLTWSELVANAAGNATWEARRAALVQAGAITALSAAVCETARLRHTDTLSVVVDALVRLAGNDVAVGEALTQPVAALVGAVYEAVRGRQLHDLERACGALAVFAVEAGESVAVETVLLRSGTAAALVVAVYEAVSSRHEDALERACEALAGLSAVAGGAAVMMRADAPAALVAAAHVAITHVGIGDESHEAVMEYACEALANLAAGDAGVKTLLVHANVPATLVASVRAVARASYPDSDALLHSCHGLLRLSSGSPEIKAVLMQTGAPEMLVEVCLAAWEMDGEDEIIDVICSCLENLVCAETRSALVRAGAHEVFLLRARDPRSREVLLVLAGPDAAYAAREPLGEPLDRIAYRVRVARASSQVPQWAEKHAHSLSAWIKTLRCNSFMYAFVARSCVLAHGDELTPDQGWRNEWGAFRTDLLDSAERAVLAILERQ